MMSIWATLAASLLGAFGAAAAAWVAGYWANKTAKEARTNEAKKAEEKASAEDLDSILYPAITSIDIQKYIEHRAYFRTGSVIAFLEDSDKEVENIVKSFLSTKDVSRDSKARAVMDYMRAALLANYNLTLFLQRYNIGSNLAVELDIEKLNKDIQFVNKTLGKHYKTYKLDGK